MGTTQYNIQQPQVKPLPSGASTPQQAGVVRMQANNQTQNANNQALAGGRKNKRGGGSITIPPTKVYYTETSAGSNSVNAQTKANVTASVQNQENKSMDSGAFQKGGKKRNKSRKSGKRKSKRRRTRKYRK